MFKTDHAIKLPAPEKMPQGNTSLFRWLYYFTSPYHKIIGGFTAYRVVRYIYFALLPLVIGYTIDAFEQGKVHENVSFYVTLLIGYLIPYAAMMVANHVFAFEAAAYEKVSRVITMTGVKHLNTLPLEWHEQQGSGGKMQKVMNARKAFSEIGIIFRWIMFPVFGNFIGSLIAIFTLEAPLYYVAFYMLFCGTYLFASWYMGRPVAALFDRYYAKIEKLLSGVYEFVSSMRTVKAFHLQSYIDRKAMELETDNQEAIFKTFWVLFTRWVVMNFIGCFWLIVFAGLGFYLAYIGSLSIGAYATTFFIAYNLWVSMETFGTTQDQLYEYTTALRRLTDVLNVEAKQLDIEPLQDLPKNWDHIAFKDVTFTYPNTDDQGVSAINFSLKRGEKVAFVGESGAGKSTLVKLLMKQMLPDSGSIQIGDADSKHLRTGDFLSHIGFVPQDVELFNLSIRDNILIDRDEIVEKDYKRALEQAALDDFIDSLPEGDETLIGEKGIKLSGGQRQRLGIARALVRKTDIIVFDEATSSLDSLSEQKIQTAMANAFKDHTVFLIAHRLSTVRHVDTIIVLDKGRIVEQGSFDALIEKDGQFARLWAIQSSAEKTAA